MCLERAGLKAAPAEGVGRRYSFPGFLWLVVLPLFAVGLISAACGSETTVETVSPTPTAVQQQVPEIPSPRPAPDGPLSLDQQKERLKAITKELFAGETEEGLPRLAIEPDARDHRQGGIQLVIEMNGDEYEDVGKNKAELDRWMRDAYEAVFTAGHELTEATISARMRAVDGRTGITQAVVYRTRLKKETAEGVDWAAKDSLDFNEIWDTLLLNRRWREALGEQSGLR